MIKENINIDSSEQVAGRVLKTWGIKTTIIEVNEVLKKEMDMSYRKIVKSALHANSEKNLFLRQRFAVKWIALTQKKTIFLNIDETWLDMSDFRRMKWRPKYSSNSNPTILVWPRISMITGIDTLGNVYLTLTQSNSNSQMMECFFRQLVLKLDKDRIGWRDNTIIIMDNASYHKSTNAIKLYESLRIPLMFTGPHSYDAAPAELFFAKFKSVDLNPERLPMGKK